MSTLWTKIGGLTTPSKFLTALVLLVAFETGYASFRSGLEGLNPALKSVDSSDLSCLRGTNYNLPSAENYTCASGQKVLIHLGQNNYARICPQAAAAARMQGSIHLSHKGTKYIYRASQAVERIPKGCLTTTGAAAVCLIPYIHIAADPAYHNMGDIIEVPLLKGVAVPHPNGSGTMPHPGFLIVADTGGRIKGENRFDFFIGPRSFLSKSNPFGPHGLKMSDEKNCIMGFRKIKGETSLAQQLKQDLKLLTDGTRMIAMAKIGVAQGEQK